MKKLLTLTLIFASAVIGLMAQVQISKVEAANPSDEVFMDMAVTVAQTASAQSHAPQGAVVVLNGAWRASGMAVGGSTAEEDALARTRRTTIPTASVYTVNQPTDRALDAMAEAKISKVFYVNPMEDVIKSGLASAADYIRVSEQRPGLQVIRIDYAPAARLIK